MSGALVVWRFAASKGLSPSRVVHVGGEGGSRQLIHQGSTASLGGFFGKLADPLGARMYQRDMNSNFNNLKALLEETRTLEATPDCTARPAVRVRATSPRSLTMRKDVDAAPRSTRAGGERWGADGAG